MIVPFNHRAQASDGHVTGRVTRVLKSAPDMPDHAKSALPSWVHWLFGVAIIALAVDSGLVLFDTSTGFIERVIGASINFLTGFAVLGLVAYGFSLLIRLARKYRH